MMLQYFENLESTILSRMQDNPAQVKPRNKYGLEMARLGKRLYNGENRVAWCGVTAPFDLLHALGVVPSFVEFISGMLSFGGIADSFLEATEHEGYAADTCASHKAVIGAAIKGILPVPDFLVATTAPCSGGVAVIEHLARTFKKDHFVLHIPKDESGDNVRFLADQLRDMVKFVSDHTGKPLDEDVLRDVIMKTNKAREILLDVYRLARQIPSPLRYEELHNFGITMPLILGSDAAIEVAQTYRDVLEKRIQSKSISSDGEHIRLLWMQSRIQFKNPLIRMLENEYKAMIVVDELNDICWEPIDPDDPFTGFAKKTISCLPFNGTAQKRIEHMKKLAREYQVDGAINPCHFGCRQGTGIRGLVEIGMREIGVPVLNLEVDLIDSRNFAEGQMKTRLEAFIEMLQGRSNQWGQNKIAAL